MRKNELPEQPTHGFFTLETPPVDLSRPPLRRDLTMNSYVVGHRAVDAFRTLVQERREVIVGKFSTTDETYRKGVGMLVGRHTASMICRVGYGATDKDILPQILAEE